MGAPLSRRFFARDPDVPLRRHVLSRAFFARDADVVARDLLGRVLVHETPGGRIACRIVETEAYFGPPGRNPHLARRRDMPAPLRMRLLAEGDPASHSFPGITKRNSVMYGGPGVAYVYLIYGMHDCMNVVTGPEEDHEPQAVLLRAGEPVEGIGQMIANRGREMPPREVASGPAKLAKAMGITRAHYGHDITSGAVHFERGRRIDDAQITPRIGVVGGEDLPLRYVVRGNEHVPGSKRRKSR